MSENTGLEGENGGERMGEYMPDSVSPVNVCDPMLNATTQLDLRTHAHARNQKLTIERQETSLHPLQYG